MVEHSESQEPNSESAAYTRLVDAAENATMGSEREGVSAILQYIEEIQSVFQTTFDRFEALGNIKRRFLEGLGTAIAEASVKSNRAQEFVTLSKALEAWKKTF